MENVFDLLKARGLVAQATNEDAIRELLAKEKVTFYIGFDATADSLHVGHFLQMVVMKHLQDAGHRPIALLGTGTTMVGDPTGKTDMRKMLTVEQIDHNALCFQQQMSKFIDFSDGKALMLRNGDWLRNLNYIEFLRNVGVHFSVNKMLAAECFKSRMEKGLSFLEFNYMLMQSYDFLHLHQNYNCKMEFGGNDQWANIIGGVDLVRKATGDEVFGLTFTLLTTKDGRKMGKTEGGAVWLDPNKTSPYDFFQYWRNIDDQDVTNCLKLLTSIPLDEIDAIDVTSGSAINAAKERLAFELTKTVHSEAEAQKALDTARQLFSGAADHEHMPSTQLDSKLVNEGSVAILDILVAAQLSTSKGEGRRLVQQGGIVLDGEKVTDPLLTVSAEKLQQGVVIRKGKKIYQKITLA
ncbi:MAG: tyrosyl-tRNA synthetase [Clostridiales bacterium]|jgi:tyrosyl-tRNA synthetase|nr:tyrosyl-tRNA synthetase [Clostridiales bacterium]